MLTCLPNSYAISGGAGPWENFVDKCQEFEDNGGVVRGISCVGKGVFYLIGAVAAFGAGQAGATYIANEGVTMHGMLTVLSIPASVGLSFSAPPFQDHEQRILLTS
jgi:hypothetical protein